MGYLSWDCRFLDLTESRRLIGLAPHTNFELEGIVLPDLLEDLASQSDHLDKSLCPNLHLPIKFLCHSVIPSLFLEPF